MRFSYLILLGVFAFFGLNLQGQSKYYSKALKCYEAAKYTKALKSIEKAKADRSNQNKAILYLLEAKTYLAINKETPSEDWTKKAVKAAIRAQEKASNPKVFVNENAEFYKSIAAINMKDAMRYYNQKRYSKAITLFKRSLDLSSDSFVEYLLGKSYIKYNDFRRGMPIMDKLLNEQFALYQQSKVAPSFLADGFNVYTEALIEKGFADSSEIYLDMGLEMFPNDVELLKKQKVIWVKMTSSIPLSLSLFQFLDKATHVYPYDSFFTFKKNGVYLMFMANQLSGKKMEGSLDWVKDFIREKTTLANKNQKGVHKKWDYFLEKDSQIILEKLVFYFGNFEEYRIQRGAFVRYAKAKFNGANLKAIKHLESLFPSSQVARLYRQELMENKSQSASAQRYDWYKSLLDFDNKNSETYEALLTLNRDIKKSNISYALKKQVEQQYTNLIVSFWNECLSAQDYWKAYELSKLKHNITSTQLSKLWERTILEDFKVNYYGSRVLRNVPSSEPNGFTWNGEATSCYPGNLPDSILKKVVQRINYFRRTAGLLDPVALNVNYNKACQEAVLFYSANGNLTHKLNENLSCYTGQASVAAEKSLLTAGAHTTLAITSFMADKSNTVGNRRWLLYPPTKFMGFGCTDDRTALWCVNDVKWDTSTYINKAIAWPPEGYSPSIFQFNNWSYSAYQNFEGAKVEMVDISDGTRAYCQVKEIVNGYGMPTLVWQPNLKRKPNAKSEFKIIITLKSGKQINYKVLLLPVNV